MILSRKLKHRHFFKYTTICLFGLMLISCSNQKTEQSNEISSESDSNSFMVDIFDFKDQNGKIEKSDNSLILSGEDTWLAYELSPPKAGRYRVILNARSNDSISNLWIEDYYDNKDDRTYNITGDMPVSFSNENNFRDVVKDGSPMNVGIHKIKLHLRFGNVEIRSLKFHLIKDHRPSPETLTQKMDGDKWELVWSDEFEGEGLPDTTKWTYDIGDWGWGNGELQYYTEARKKNARLENGNLIIEAHKNENGHLWSSARLTTRGKVAFIYGKIEFRAMVPPNKGNWAAGWTLGNDYVDELSWPYCGEIDILESVGYEMNDSTGLGIAHASAHCGAYYFKLGNQPTGTTPVERMHDQFHTYAIEWFPNGITATVDGKAYFHYNDTSSALSWPFDKAQNLILNLTMGGGWGGLQGMDESVSSQKMILDYVRVYEKR